MLNLFGGIARHVLSPLFGWTKDAIDANPQRSGAAATIGAPLFGWLGLSDDGRQTIANLLTWLAKLIAPAVS